ncbi:synaptotagmin-like protein 3 [Myotis lucifugus]|uniref:synaptotagmin-like protein 3 n=1 Tax=Myotis lucifugus TaxID=59463 RepID=UPI0003C49007|nr:synaptotagmin-like protein 3 [Myotis lucifugus]
MTSDKQLLSTGPRPGARTERRSQSDTAINATTRKVSAPDILMPLSQESPKRSTNPVSKQGGLSAPPAPSAPFSGGSRRGSLISVNSTCTEIGNFDNADVTGEIEFAIRYCFETRSLEICIQACKNLAYGEERKKKCNPYVKTYLLPDRSAQGKRKTGVQRNTVDPTFQETLKVLPGQTLPCGVSPPWAGAGPESTTAPPHPESVEQQCRHCGCPRGWQSGHGWVTLQPGREKGRVLGTVRE